MQPREIVILLRLDEKQIINVTLFPKLPKMQNRDGS